MLAVLTSAQLNPRPLGDTAEEQVRKDGALGITGKPDSHDVCFIADGDTRAFLHRRLGSAPGLDTDGRA